jgi:hypothetical protein
VSFGTFWFILADLGKVLVSLGQFWMVWDSFACLLRVRVSFACLLAQFEQVGIVLDKFGTVLNNLG